VLLERVVVEVLVAVGEVRAGDTRGRALAVRSFWIRILPFLEPKPPATQSSSASRSTRAWCDREVPGLAREVLQRDVLELRALLDEELDDGVRVAASSGAADAYSSISVKREPASATTSSRQKSEPPGTEFAMRT
jgi:hypothetical protein